MVSLDELTLAVESGEREEAARLVTAALNAGVEPRDILDAMVAAMAHVGDRFQHNEIFVPEMLIAARAMQDGMAILEPVLVGAGIRPTHTAVLGTVAGDLHDIGKNLVGMMWKGANIDVIDIGVNASAAKFAEAARDHHAEVVGISALLTTTMLGMRHVVTAIRSAGLDAKIIVGGAPVTQEFADEIGADAYAADAGAAVDVVRRLMSA